MQLREIPKVSQQQKKEIHPFQEMKQHYNFIGGLRCLGDFILSSSEDTQLKLWDSNRTMIKKVLLDLKDYPINHIALSQDGYYLAAASDDGMIRLLETENWKVEKEWKAHESYVTKVAFAGDKLVSISHDATAKIWDVETGNLLHELQGHENWVYSLAVSPDNQQLFTTSNDCSVKVWDINTGEEIQHLVDGGQLVYAGDGISLIVGGSNATGIGNKAFVRYSLWADNGYVYSGARDLVCWNPADWSIKWQIDLSYDAICGLEYLPQFNILIAVSDIIYGINPETGKIEFSQASPHKEAITSCAILAEDYLVTGSEKGQLAMWNLHELVSEGSTVEFGGDVHRPVFVPAAKRIVAGSWLGGQFSIWDERGEFVKALKGFPAERDNLALAPLPHSSHQLILTDEGKVSILDARSGNITEEIPLKDPSCRITEVFWVNDKEAILSITSRQPRLLNIQTKEISVIASDFNLGGLNFKINEELILLQLAYNLSGSPADDLNYNEHSFKVEKIRDAEIMEKQAPLLLYNWKKKEIVQEWWFPSDQVEDTWGSYGWPLVGGPNNELIAASYLKEKKMYFYHPEHQEPLKIEDMSWYASSKYSSVYGVYATEDYMLFRVDSTLLKYNIATENWQKFQVDGYLYHINEEKGYISAIHAKRKLLVWRIRDFQLLLEKDLGFSAKNCMIYDKVYIYSEDKGFVVFDLEE